MEIIKFTKDSLKDSKTYKNIGSKYSSGQVTIIGGSKLFHGAPILALKGASRMVSMTYFASPEEDKDFVKFIKSGLGSFVWVPRDDIESYVDKSDAVLVGPGLMRSHIKEKEFVCDDEGLRTRQLTLDLLKKFPTKKWVVDGGSLQVIAADELPEGSVITPNNKEFEMLFHQKVKDDLEERGEQIRDLAKQYKIVILTKDTVSIASDGDKIVHIEGGNEGLIKGGVGDVIAGLTLGFMAKNDGLFSVSAASYLVKKAAESLAKKCGFMFNSDDLVEEVKFIFGREISDL